MQIGQDARDNQIELNRQKQNFK